MNRNLKFAVAAAIATLGMAGHASAALVAPTGFTGSGSMFLYVFDDKTVDLNGTGASIIFNLGDTGTFNTTMAGANQSWDIAALGTAWNTYIQPLVSNINTPAGAIKFGVYGQIGAGGATGTQSYTTVNGALGGVSGTAMANFSGHEAGLFTTYGLSGDSGYSAQVINDASGGYWGNTLGGFLNGASTASLGGELSYYKFTSTGTAANKAATKLQFTTAGTGFQDYFTLSSAGQLNYVTAAVPEADTYAMMLAGLGLVGFMVRRRKAA